MKARRVGFIGLGAMGSAMAARLIEHRVDVAVYNRTPAKAEALGEMGARVAGSPADAAADRDVLMLCLSGEDAVEEVLFGKSGAVSALPWGAVIADLSTVSPAFARALAERIAPRAARVVDACVLGNVQHARTGELRFMVGGPETDFEAVRDLLEVLGKEVVHLGGPGLGATMKLVLNLLMGVEMQALAEAVVFGESAGLPRERILHMIASSGFSSPVMRFKAGAMERRSFERADFRLALMRKDLTLIMGESQRLGIPLPVASATYETLTAAAALGLGDLDCSSIVAFMERVSRLQTYEWPGSPR